METKANPTVTIYIKREKTQVSSLRAKADKCRQVPNLLLTTLNPKSPKELDLLCIVLHHTCYGRIVSLVLMILVIIPGADDSLSQSLVLMILVTSLVLMILVTIPGADDPYHNPRC